MTKKEEFIKALAKFLTANETEMSIKLQLHRPEAERWRDLRQATPLFGYYDGEDGRIKAEKELADFLE